MNGHTLFVSDTHLDDSRPQALEQFLLLLKRAVQADALYILGDLFEAWLGDDDQRPPHPQILQGLAALTATGTPVYVVRGNRDFLLGQRFASETGACLLEAITRIDLYGEAVVILHGDLLCTSDHEYQAFRAMVTDPDWQQQQLQRPLAERVAIAARMRSESQRLNSVKTEDIMDVDPAAVIDCLLRYDVRCMIHGHTHRPAMHTLDLSGMPASRIVLPDWYDSQRVLQVSARADYQFVSVAGLIG